MRPGPSYHGQPKLRTSEVGDGTRLISSHVFQPTSPAHTSLVPGRTVMRNGLRRPCATMRRAFGSALVFGLPGIAAPGSGSIRRIAPSRLVGSPVVRRSWARSAPPWAVGGVIEPPGALGGSPHGLTGEPSCPWSSKLKLAPSPALPYSPRPGPKARAPSEVLLDGGLASRIITC